MIVVVVTVPVDAMLSLDNADFLFTVAGVAAAPPTALNFDLGLATTDAAGVVPFTWPSTTLLTPAGVCWTDKVAERDASLLPVTIKSVLRRAADDDLRLEIPYSGVE